MGADLGQSEHLVQFSYAYHDSEVSWKPPCIFHSLVTTRVFPASLEVIVKPFSEHNGKRLYWCNVISWLNCVIWNVFNVKVFDYQRRHVIP